MENEKEGDPNVPANDFNFTGISEEEKLRGAFGEYMTRHSDQLNEIRTGIDSATMQQGLDDLMRTKHDKEIDKKIDEHSEKYDDYENQDEYEKWIDKQTLEEIDQLEKDTYADACKVYGKDAVDKAKADFEKKEAEDRKKGRKKDFGGKFEQDENVTFSEKDYEEEEREMKQNFE